MKIKCLYCLIFFTAAAPAAYAQLFGPVPDRFESLQQNSVSSLEASKSLLWIGPGLNSYSETTGNITVPVNADSVFNSSGRVFSLSVSGEAILTGIGFTSLAGGSPVNAALGYYLSRDHGSSWSFLPFHLDERPPSDCDAASVGPPCDIEFQYGEQTYIRNRISVPEQSPPYDVDFRGNTFFAAHWASGLMRSRDSGASWERIILPPSSDTTLSPQHSYNWYSRTPDGAVINRYDPRFDNNLLGFSVLIDRADRVWVGTAAGVNVSDNALSAPAEKVSWRRFVYDPENSTGLLSAWVQKIREEPETDRIWMTNWKADPENRDEAGIVYTEDEGITFHHFLKGVRVNDIGFHDGVIYAAADDQGATWKTYSGIVSTNTYIREGARFYAVASTDNGIWIGTSDGLAFSDNHGSSWSILRTDLPPGGGNAYQPETPDNNSYAYPNPFSPTHHSEVRIKFRAAQSDTPIIRIFDFGMNRIRTLYTGTAPAEGVYETVWDGRDEGGHSVAGGVYFYSVETASGFINGKILLLD